MKDKVTLHVLRNADGPHLPPDVAPALDRVSGVCSGAATPEPAGNHLFAQLADAIAELDDVMLELAEEHIQQELGFPSGLIMVLEAQLDASLAKVQAFLAQLDQLGHLAA